MIPLFTVCIVPASSTLLDLIALTVCNVQLFRADVAAVSAAPNLRSDLGTIVPNHRTATLYPQLQIQETSSHS